MEPVTEAKMKALLNYKKVPSVDASDSFPWVQPGT